MSASKARVHRPQYEELLADFQAGRFSALVCWDLDRLTRQPRQLEDWVDAAERDGLVVITANGEADLSTDGGRMYARIKAAVARAEVERKSARQKAANVQRLEAGKPLPGGKRRFGYEKDHSTPRESEATYIRWAYAEVEAGRSLYSLAKELNADGIRAPYGHTWDGSKLRKVLLNSRNIGVLSHQGIEQTDSAITPLVEVEQFERVKAILMDEARTMTPGPKVRVGLVNGIATCGVCGTKLKTSANTQKGKLVLLYKCSAPAEARKAGQTHPAIRRDLMDTAVMEEVFQWVVEHPEAEESAEVSPRLGALLAERDEVDRQRKVVQALAKMPGADLGQVAKDLADLGKESDRLAAEAERERGAQSRTGLLEAVRGEWWARRHIAEYTELEQEALDAWPGYWESLGLDKQREVVRSMFNITLHPGRGPERVEITAL